VRKHFVPPSVRWSAIIICKATNFSNVGIQESLAHESCFFLRCIYRFFFVVLLISINKLSLDKFYVQINKFMLQQYNEIIHKLDYADVFVDENNTKKKCCRCLVCVQNGLTNCIHSGQRLTKKPSALDARFNLAEQQKNTHTHTSTTSIIVIIMQQWSRSYFFFLARKRAQKLL
jgi:hypothetical protein